MAFTPSDIATLKAALASGVSEVRFADNRLVRYRSLSEMREIIRMAEADIAPATPQPRSFLVEF